MVSRCAARLASQGISSRMFDCGNGSIEISSARRGGGDVGLHSALKAHGSRHPSRLERATANGELLWGMSMLRSRYRNLDLASRFQLGVFRQLRNFHSFTGYRWESPIGDESGERFWICDHSPGIGCAVRKAPPARPPWKVSCLTRLPANRPAVEFPNALGGLSLIGTSLLGHRSWK